MAFQDFDQISQRRKLERQQRRKRITIAITTTVVLLVVVGAAIGVYVYSGNDEVTKSNTKKESKPDVNKDDNADNEAPPKKTPPKKSPAPTKAPSKDNAPPPTPLVADKAVKTICSPTDYKETCESSLLQAVKDKIVKADEPKDLVMAAMVVASKEIDKAVEHLNTLKFDTPEKKAAFDDCMALLTDAREELNSSASAIDGAGLSALTDREPDFNNWLSAVLSYQQTCIDGVPEGEEKNAVEKALNITKELSSDSLAIVSLASTILPGLVGGSSSGKRRLMAIKQNAPALDRDMFPTWMNPRVRRMLRADNPTYTPNMTVAKDGSGNFTTLNAALAALPATYEGRFVIYLKEGIYEEHVVITKKMVNLTIYGDGSQKSVIAGSKSKLDGITVLDTATFVVLGHGFLGQSIGFRNTAGVEKRQAVALRTQADHAIFLNCRMEGFENTLYVQTHRQFYRSCYITGTVDVIFGDAAAVFQNCDIVLKKPLENQQNIIMAHGRIDKRQATGFVLQNCQITADTTLEPEKAKIKSYLGRPEKAYSRAVVIETEIGDVISPEGWISPGDYALDTLSFYEFGNKGPRADTNSRVKWPGFKVISKDEARNFTVGPFIQGDVWVNATSVPVRLGLFTA